MAEVGNSVSRHGNLEEALLNMSELLYREVEWPGCRDSVEAGEVDQLLGHCLISEMRGELSWLVGEDTRLEVDMCWESVERFHSCCVMATQDSPHPVAQPVAVCQLGGMDPLRSHQLALAALAAV